MLVGYPPFIGEDSGDVFKKILNNPLVFEDDEWNYVSEEAKDLIKNMLEKDPANRISI